MSDENDRTMTIIYQGNLDGYINAKTLKLLSEDELTELNSDIAVWGQIVTDALISRRSTS